MTPVAALVMPNFAQSTLPCEQAEKSEQKGLMLQLCAYQQITEHGVVT